ncbi:TorF family putative porin [Brevundimonas balnearis]|uniref:TorF family putative porin n=1 Tax=Brevundimonas balnearis TaxID=1572858 RepID=A0ABV6QZZ9_9CAUL
MKSLGLTIAGAALLIGTPTIAQDGGWALSGRVGAVSDYYDRGYMLSEGVTAQGEVTASRATGAYAGVWLSGIDPYGVDADGEGARVEVTAYAGWAGEAVGFEVDVGVWSNHYPDGTDVDYVEFPVQIARAIGPARLSAGVIYAPDQTGVGGEDNTWAWLGADYAPIAWPVSLHARVGHERGGFAPDGKVDWRLGAEAPAGPLTLGLDWIDSDIDDGALVARVFFDF